MKFEQIKRGLRNTLAAGAVAAGSMGGLAQGQVPAEKSGVTAMKPIETKEEKIEREGRENLAKTKAKAAIEKVKAESRIVIERAKAEEAKAKQDRYFLDHPESIQSNKTSDLEFSANKAPKTVEYHEIDILDEEGNKIGKAIKGSKAWEKLERLRIKKNAEIEKAKARGPIFYYPGYPGYPGYPAGYYPQGQYPIGYIAPTSRGEGGVNYNFRTGP